MRSPPVRVPQKGPCKTDHHRTLEDTPGDTSRRYVQVLPTERLLSLHSNKRRTMDADVHRIYD